MKTAVEEISKDFFKITLPMPFRLEHVHTYALLHNGRVAMFDTGPNFPETMPSLEASLSRLGHHIGQIDQIFITHFHADHCGIAGLIQNISGASVRMAQVEAERALNFISADDAKLLELMSSFYLREGLPADVLERILKIFKMFKKVTAPFTVSSYLKPGEKFSINGLEFEVLFTPGHTRAQTCFFCRERGLLLAGDHVLPHITPNLSPDLEKPEFRPLQAFIGSLQKLKGLPASMVYPAHGEPFNDLPKRIDEMIEHHRERKALVLDAVRTFPKTSYEVSRVVFGPDLPDFDKMLALNEAYVHLIELETEGVIEALLKDGQRIYTLKQSKV